MIKNITNISFWFLLFLCGWTGNYATAQLSGNYTIGGASGASNFATWSDFATELNKNGVSGKTVVTVQSNLSVTSTIELNTCKSNGIFRDLVADGYLS